METLKQYFAPSIPSDIYISFCVANNVATSEKAVNKAMECIKWVREDRLLVESDLHAVSTQADNDLERITRRICKARGWDLETGVKILDANWKRFVLGS